MRLAGVARGDREPRHGADRRQRLAAKAQRADGDEIVVGELGGGVALDRQRQVGARHALAVVGDANQPPAAAVGEHVDAARAGIERVLDQLLDHARRTLDHLAGGDAVDDGFGELADGHGRLAWTTNVARIERQRNPRRVLATRRHPGTQSNDGLARRKCLMPPRRFLPSMRRSREPWSAWSAAA